MKTILIENVKGIKLLKFDVPEKSGTYLLAGTNASGKTTLLTCLHRLQSGTAFANGFKTESQVSSVDQYARAKITYRTDAGETVYQKRAKRWVAQKNSKKVLSSFGFSDSIFIRGDSSRIEATKSDIVAGNDVLVNKTVRDALNNLLDTTLFNHLYYRKKRGPGNEPLFYMIKDGVEQYTEKRFSTGEIALLRLVNKLQDIRHNSLVLIDEGELALHPKVQKNLFRYLKSIAKEKNLTIMMSTHSPVLLGEADRQNIILLESDQASLRTVSVVYSCYPARAIGVLDYLDASIDFLFFVEDDMAKMILEKLLHTYFFNRNASICPLYRIIPVGGYRQTAELAICIHNELSSKKQTKIFAVIDADAYDASTAYDSATFPSIDPAYIELHKKNQGIIRGLTITPEVWIIKNIENSDYQQKIKLTNCCKLDVIRSLECADYRNASGNNERAIAKSKLKALLHNLTDDLIQQDMLLNKIVDILIQGENSDFANKNLIHIF